MMWASTIMLVLATAHVALTLERMLEGFASPPTIPLTYYSTLNLWSHVTKNTIYATQEIVGNAGAVCLHYETRVNLN